MSNASDLYQTLFDVFREAILIVDQESGHIIDANMQALRMTGLPPAELKRVNYKTFFRIPDDAGTRPECVFCPSLSAGLKTGMCFETLYIDYEARTYLVLLGRGSADLPARICPRTEVGDYGWSDLQDFPNIIGQSERIRDVCRLIGSVAKTDATVLIEGESGTGKEVVANAIHIHSLRGKHPFVKVNCAALSETLLESELFGHVKGAFTGAIIDRRGRFQQANNGTILLDEIGCMSLAGQAKLLRVLQEHEFEPVGSSKTLPVDVRVLASTNVNLAEAVKLGRFREDLYYRLNVFSIPLPPLRERKQDIHLLVRHFLYKNNANLGKSIEGIDFSTHALLMQHNWPGNIRELENVIEHAAIVEQGPTLLPASLPMNLAGSHPNNDENELTAMPGLREKLTLFERQVLLDTLLKANGVKKLTAAMLGIDARNLPYLLRKHHLGY
ncbi:Nitrogen regulation protein NR(I) [Methylomonas albis]|uniref:Sigma 54-interacting transcriptional regulator n=1 Tax=Methylomonas albis TaxID=1854563 RepID=A0ABR9D0Y8_9GAMM|nr:sigma 54-interacting transcriptional regulator [Methylomonas albis]MBD9356758.1 sigma 54-interacting transcriptional regulator [Methylomonas albis]CAD6879908.1 Nitrogen regulation protein NR(I) [Methylomonas albis]